LRVISRRKLLEFAAVHEDAKAALDEWYKVASKAKWQNLAEARATYPHADPVGTCTVFNIREGNYRLIAYLNYRGGRLYVLHVLTHREYDKGGWRRDCDC
jgi:mRNA interferase HigB